VLGVKVAASTVWEILKDAGIDPTYFMPFTSSNVSTTNTAHTKASRTQGR